MSLEEFKKNNYFDCPFCGENIDYENKKFDIQTHGMNNTYRSILHCDKCGKDGG